MDRCYNSFLSSIEQNLDKDVKPFWTFISNRKHCNSLPQTMTFDGLSASDNKGICELFSKYFGTVFEDPSPSSMETLEIISSNTLSRIVLSHDQVLNKLRLLDPSKGPDSDGIPARFIKACSSELSIPLTLIFNNSLNTGVFPSIWKTAHVIPIYKSGNKAKCANYRPVSILSCLAKVFESLVYDHIYNLVKPILSPNQHGFIKNRSTVSNLLVYKNYLCNAFASRGQVDLIYTDFQKAFDKVDHVILCQNINSHGVHGSLLRWVTSYLENRSQLVAIKGYINRRQLLSNLEYLRAHIWALYSLSSSSMI